MSTMVSLRPTKALRKCASVLWQAKGVLAVLFGKHQRFGTRMQIVALAAAGGHNGFERVHKILLERFKAGHGHVERGFLRNYTAGCVVRVHHDDSVFDAGAAD